MHWKLNVQGSTQNIGGFQLLFTKQVFILTIMEAQPFTEQFTVYPKRFLVVFLFSLAQFMTSCLINTLTPIARFLEVIYDQEPLIVNSGALLFALMYPIFTFPAAYVIDTYGTKVGIAIGSIFCIVGTGLRMLVNSSFAWVIMGQVVAGVGRPFILNCQAKIGANWFQADKRAGITQLLTLVLNVSLIIGLFIPGLVFGKYDIAEVDDAKIQLGKDKTFDLMMIEFILAIVCLLPNIIFQQTKPPTPPSESAGIVTREPFKVAIPKLLKNRNYLLLLLAFGCYFGIFNGLSIILSFLLNPWFHENLAIAVGYVGGSPVVSGIIGVIILGPMQRKSGNFKKFIIICMLGSISAMIIFYPLLETSVLALASLVSAYNSFFLIPLVPIMLELGCEIAFPVAEGTAAGLLFAMGNFAGFALGVFLSLIVQGQTKGQTLGGLAFCFAMFLVGFALVWFMKEEKNRIKFERQASERRKSGMSLEVDPEYPTQTSENGQKTELKQNLLSKEGESPNVML